MRVLKYKVNLFIKLNEFVIKYIIRKLILRFSNQNNELEKKLYQILVEIRFKKQ
jgi:hypothetical protein